jgi:hypothetical protein
MAKLDLQMTMPGYGNAATTITFDDADAQDILAAFKESIPQITDAQSLVKFFASGIAGQIQGVTQNYRTGKNPQPIPPVDIT